MVTVGQLVAGRYRVLHPLAAGGMGGVWLGVDEERDEPVALKKCLLPEGLTPDEQILFRVWTVREAHAFALVGHPNVVRTLDVLADDDAPWIVMEYVPSRSLQQVLDESGPLPPARVAGIGLAVLEGLLGVRRAGLLHLDVKPSNVLVGTDGRVVLTDFGPAVTVEGVRALAEVGIVLGSPKYLAPERLTGGVALPESDLWSLGATLYHAVEGRPPFVRRTTAELLHALATEEPDPPVRAGPLTSLIEGLLRRDPTTRPDPLEVQRELRVVVNPGAADEVPERPPMRAALTGPARPPLRRRFAVVATVVAVLAVLIIAIVLLRPDGSSGEARADPVLPAGYSWFSGPGYRLGVPEGWELTPEGEGGDMAFYDPTTSWPTFPSLRLVVEQKPDDLVSAMTARESEIHLAAYHRTRIEQVPDSPDTVWEFTYDDPGLGPMRAQQRMVDAGNGLVYVFDWRAPRDEWTVRLAELDRVLGAFRPVG